MALKQGLITLVLLLALSACRPAAAPDVERQAAQQATAIIQSAQATAKAMVQNPNVPEGLQSITPTALPPGPLQLENTPAITGGIPDGEAQHFELVNVGLAGEGGFVIVYYMAPPELAHKLLIPGAVSVTNEKTGFSYNQIPVMETVGALISIPKKDGQKGYVMLVIPTPHPLKKGDLVTVILGDLKEPHVVVQ